MRNPLAAEVMHLEVFGPLRALVLRKPVHQVLDLLWDNLQRKRLARAFGVRPHRAIRMHMVSHNNRSLRNSSRVLEMDWMIY